MTTYCVEMDLVWCGCFKGTLAEFTAKIERTHADNPFHLANYRAGAALLRAFRDSCLAQGVKLAAR